MAGRKRKNNAEYFSHDAGMRNDEKVKALRNKFGIKGYAFWCMFLEVLCDKENFTFERTDISIMLLSGDIGFDESEINDMLDYIIKLKLVFEDGKILFSQHLIDRLEPLLNKRVKMRDIYQKAISDKKKAISGAEIDIPEEESSRNGNFCGSQTSEIPQRKGKIKESKVKNKKTYVENSDEFRLAKLLSDLILENNSKNKSSISAKKDNYQKWSDIIRLANQEDDRSFQQIEYLINWSQKDDWWFKTIHSPLSLRKNFDKMADAVKEERNNSKSVSKPNFNNQPSFQNNPSIEQMMNAASEAAQNSSVIDVTPQQKVLSEN